MSKYVVDTNVILAASSQHSELSAGCVVECVKRLAAIMASGTIFTDQAGKIVVEYCNKSKPWTGNKPGDLFLKWVINNQGNPKRCVQVHICESGDDRYDDFPDTTLHDEFDPPDRKFIAVAHASGMSPTVLQAADCKWLNWNERLKDSGISVEFVCPADICRFYQAKFPGRNMPDF